MDVEFNLPPKKEVMVYAPLATKQAQYYKATLERTIFGKNCLRKYNMMCVLLLIDFIEENKKAADKKDDETTPIDTKRPARVSSEKAKKRLK